MRVRELGMQTASDEVIFDRAQAEGRSSCRRIPISEALLAAGKQTSPSVILFGHGSQHRPGDRADVLRANLARLLGALADGSLVVIEPDRIESGHYH